MPRPPRAPPGFRSRSLRTTGRARRFRSTFRPPGRQSRASPLGAARGARWARWSVAKPRDWVRYSSLVPWFAASGVTQVGKHRFKGSAQAAHQGVEHRRMDRPDEPQPALVAGDPDHARFERLETGNRDPDHIVDARALDELGLAAER